MKKFLLILLSSCVFLHGCGDKSDAIKTSKTANNEVGPEISTSQFDTGLRGANAQVLSGTNSGIAGGQVAKFEIPLSAAEKKYLKDMPCLDENECYGDRQFRQDIIKTYPDIGLVKFPSDDTLKGLPKDEVKPFKDDFYRALYLAKRITIANGQTLFDFMKNCGKGFVSTNSASFSGQKNESIQFFPVLRRLDDGREEEMQILFDRTGPQVTARSPWFSTHIMQDRDFLMHHGLRCWSAN